MAIHSITIGLVIRPISLIGVAIEMDKLSLSERLVVSPLSYVLSSIWPCLGSLPISESTFPLSVIDSSSLEGIGRPLLSLLLNLPLCRAHCLLELSESEVLRATDLLALQLLHLSPRNVTSEPRLYFYD